MYKWTVTYEDFDGVERTEDFYFNFTKAELMEMELGKDGGLTTTLQRIINAKDTPSIIQEVKKLLLDSYGIKSDDGRRFIKNATAREEFEHSEPYSIMFMELATNDEKAAEFVNGIVPKDIREMALKESGKDGGNVASQPLLMSAT